MQSDTQQSISGSENKPTLQSNYRKLFHAFKHYTKTSNSFSVKT